MQIIIPMTGYGSRFAVAGYRDLKPFIKVMGKPMIEWIVTRMFPGESNFLFVCRKEHLDTIPKMGEYLLGLCHTADIFAIEKWEKRGPVYDVMKAGEMIDDQDEAIINYCDFYMSWDWGAFKKEVRERNCEGCIPCYTGFHPHLLPEKNLYASCLTDKEDNLVEIREKYSFEKDKTKARHSPGTYYFRSGALMKKYCSRLIERNITFKGEYYASLPYNLMVEDGLRVWAPADVEYFCQWGTPEDLREFEYWTERIRENSVRGGK